MASYFNISSSGESDEKLLIAKIPIRQKNKGQPSPINKEPILENKIHISEEVKGKRDIRCGFFDCHIFHTTPNSKNQISFTTKNLTCNVSYQIANNSKEEMFAVVAHQVKKLKKKLKIKKN